MKVQVARVGAAIMILKDGNVLLGKRNDDPEKAGSQLHGEGTWTLPGGKVDFGETILTAAKRELKEETDLDAKELELISVTDEIVHDAHFVTMGFLCTEFEGEVKTMEPDEMTEWGWFSLEELPTPMFKPSAKMIKNYKEKTLYNHIE
jgi:8-oxo-dGTP diphosphatase